MYSYIWIFCKKMYLKINCIQKCFVQISGASWGFYSISLNEGYTSVSTQAVRIVSWLTLCLYQRLCCRILPWIMGYVCGVLWYVNRSMQYFVMVRNTAVQFHLEKLLKAVAVNQYFFKKLRVLLFWAGFSEDILRYLWIYNL